MLEALFIVFAIAAVLGALNVVIQRQPLYSTLSLVVTLISLAAVYVTLQAHFIAAVQVIVYAGAIMVLFVFVIMLLNVREEMAPDRHGYLRWLAVPLAFVLISEVVVVVTRFRGEAITTAATDVGGASKVGVGLFTNYLLPFEVTSILILMALVGAVVLARRERK